MKLWLPGIAALLLALNAQAEDYRWSTRPACRWKSISITLPVMRPTTGVRDAAVAHRVRQKQRHQHSYQLPAARRHAAGEPVRPAG